MILDDIIRQKISDTFNPSELSVINESHMHSGTATNSHYKVVIVSQQFEGQRLLTRHRAVNLCLQDELAGQVHALAIHTYTPSEWLERQSNFPKSPNCLGGSKSDQSH